MVNCDMHDLTPDAELVHKVVHSANDSGLGPDGLPYSAYDAVPQVAIALILCMINLIFKSDLLIEPYTSHTSIQQLLYD